ncbi:hypothetical protein BGZ98_004987 [Dissophora globulifera]|nr:hypothetical protein BGZ98_004987 [Dissophora globulifera]
MSTALRNAYIEKSAVTERSCFICMKMTTKVLTAKDGGDFFYVCPSHLQDTGFAKGEGYPPEASAETLAAVAAYKKKKAEAEKKKQEAAAAAASKTEEDKRSNAAKLGSAVFSGLGSVATKAVTSVSSFINDEEATRARIEAAELEKRQREARKPEYWVLHRDIFFLRQNEFKRKNAKKTATDTLNGLSFPKVPGGL